MKSEGVVAEQGNISSEVAEKTIEQLGVLYAKKHAPPGKDLVEWFNEWSNRPNIIPHFNEKTPAEQPRALRSFLVEQASK